MDLDEKWIRDHLPPELKNESLDLFAEEYLDGLTVMAKGERGGPGQGLFSWVGPCPSILLLSAWETYGRARSGHLN